MYTSVKMDMAYIPFKWMDKNIGGHDLEHFDLTVEDFILDTIGSSRTFPSTQFFFEPRKQRVALMSITDMPPELPAGDVIKRVCLQYVRKNLEYVEKVTLLNSSFIAKDPPEDVVQQSGGLPGRMPDKYREDALIKVSQLRDDTKSDLQIYVMDSNKAKYVPMYDEGDDIRDEEKGYNRFENLFDIDSLPDDVVKEHASMQFQMSSDDKEKYNMQALRSNIDRLLITTFNLKYNNERFKPKKDDKRN